MTSISPVTRYGFLRTTHSRCDARNQLRRLVPNYRRSGGCRENTLLYNKHNWCIDCMKMLQELVIVRINKKLITPNRNTTYTHALGKEKKVEESYFLSFKKSLYRGKCTIACEFI